MPSMPSATSRWWRRPSRWAIASTSISSGWLLWRVRRKLIVSYIFIGFVPVLLVIAFFLVSGTLLFLNVSAYVLRNRIATVVDQTRFLAQTTAIELQRAQHRAGSGRHPGSTPDRRGRAVSDGVVRGRARACRAAGTGTSRVAPSATAGPWSHTSPPASIPDWVKCADVASLITSDTDPASLVVRAVAWPEGAGNAVVVDVPVGDGVATGIARRDGHHHRRDLHSRRRAGARALVAPGENSERHHGARSRSVGANRVGRVSRLRRLADGAAQHRHRQLQDGIGRGVPVPLRTVARPHQQFQLRPASAAAPGGCGRAVPDHPGRGVHDGADARTVDHRIGPRAVRRNRTRPPRRLHSTRLPSARAISSASWRRRSTR